MLNLGDEPRFLITRMSAIGDCIHTIPLVHAIRRQFPKAFIAWCTQSGAAELIDGLESLDELIVVDRNWIKSLTAIRAQRSLLEAKAFDVAIDAQGLTKSSALGWISHAPHRIGFVRGQAREFSPWLNNVLVAPQTTHVVDRYLELLRPLGVMDPTVEFRMPRRPEAIHAMDGLPATRAPFVVINPGAGWDSKIWPWERYAELAMILDADFGLPTIVIWAGDREKRWAEEISQNSPAMLAPPTKLSELSELCRRAKLFIGSDTGPMHLAAAVGTPCVAMFGPTLPEVCGPFGPGHRTVQAFQQKGTGRQRRGKCDEAMRAIKVEMVVNACENALASKAA